MSRKLVLAHKEGPVGNYARQSLDKMSQDATFPHDFAPRVLANLVSEEPNVKQVVTKVQLGEADASIVYAFDVTPAVRGALKVLAIPESLNVVARYPIAVVKDAPNAAGALDKEGGWDDCRTETNHPICYHTAGTGRHARQTAWTAAESGGDSFLGCAC